MHLWEVSIVPFLVFFLGEWQDGVEASAIKAGITD